MLVFSCGSASLVILTLVFNFVLAVHYHGKDMGEQVTDIFVPLFEVIHSGGHVLPSINLYEIVVSLIHPPRVFGPFKMSIPSLMFEIT